jgi:hypothetical protein
MQYTDLRDWIQKVDALGELRRVDGADWNLEMGAITEVYARNEPYPAILFDKIKDLSRGPPGAYRRPSYVFEAAIADFEHAAGLRPDAVHSSLSRAARSSP